MLSCTHTVVHSPTPGGGVAAPAGGGARAALPAEDADLVVGQRDALQLRVAGQQRLAQGVVERVDRPVALRRADDPLRRPVVVGEVDLDGGLADDDAVAPV